MSIAKLQSHVAKQSVEVATEQDAQRAMRYYTALEEFEHARDSLLNYLSPADCMDLVEEFEALVVEAVQHKLPMLDVGGIVVDMIRERWDREAQVLAEEDD